MTVSRRSDADPLSVLQRSLTLLWKPPSTSGRGPRPGLTVPQIVHAAVALADQRGLPALSMRNLAAELDVGTMTLYRYVPGRPELVALMCDHVFAELDGPTVATPAADGGGADGGGADGGGADGAADGAAADGAGTGQDAAAEKAAAPCVDGTGEWRVRMTAMAWEYWAFYRAHPWMLTIEQGRPILGPVAMRSAEKRMAHLADVPLDDADRLGVITLITSFVAGLARTEVEFGSAAGRTGISDDDWWGTHLPFLADATRTFPRLWAAGQAGAWADVTLPPGRLIDQLRAEQEKLFA